MKLRNIKGLPVFYEPDATVLGSVCEVVFDSDYRISHVIFTADDNTEQAIHSPSFVLSTNAVLINDMNCIKRPPVREQSTIYEKKLGDVIYDRVGREVGSISDFIISIDDHRVWGVEVYSGALNDILHGRSEVPLEQVEWKSAKSAIVEAERSPLP